MLTKTVKIKCSNSVIDQILLLKREGDSCFLEMLDEGVKIEADDYFECLKELRRFFEKKSCTVLCNGARKDVYPSRMTRQMGDGQFAYCMKLGKPAQQDDIVNIFDLANESDIGTIPEQESYYRQWVKSL